MYDRSFPNLLTRLWLGLALAASAVPATAAPLSFQAIDASPGSAVLELQADELVTMTTIPFRLVLRDAAGQPLAGTRVSCDLTMPSMTMPENRPKMTEADGGYAGEMILTCTMGEWRVTCVSEDDRGGRRTMSFDIGRARMK